MEDHQIALKLRPIVKMRNRERPIFGMHVEPQWPSKSEIDYEAVFQLVEKNRLSTYFDYYFIDLAIDNIVKV